MLWSCTSRKRLIQTDRFGRPIIKCDGMILRPLNPFSNPGETKAIRGDRVTVMYAAGRSGASVRLPNQEIETWS